MKLEQQVPEAEHVMGGWSQPGWRGGWGWKPVETTHCQLLRWILLHVGREWLRDLRCGGGCGTDHGNTRSTGAAGNSQGSVAAIAAASQRRGIPQTASLPCPPDRMIDLLYLQMNS